MQEWELSKISLAAYSSNQEILSLLILQLTKDFQSCRIDINILPDASAPIIEDCVFNALLKETNSAHSQIQQLLYRIDVSENSIGRDTDKSNLNQFIQSLTQLVIKRELQKVLIRKYYK